MRLYLKKETKMRIAIVSVDENRKLLIAESLQDYNPLPLLQTEILPTIWGNPVYKILDKHSQNAYITTTSLYDLYIKNMTFNPAVKTNFLSWMVALHEVIYDHILYIPVQQDNL